MTALLNSKGKLIIQDHGQALYVSSGVDRATLAAINQRLRRVRITGHTAADWACKARVAREVAGSTLDNSNVDMV